MSTFYFSPSLAEFTDHLVTLCDGRRGLRAGLTAEIRKPEPEPGAPSAAVLDFVASSDALDRCGEVIDPFGWQLENYRRNPVFQNAHQYGDIIFTLGKALITEVRRGDPNSPHSALRASHLFQRIEFAVEVNPMARIAYGLYQGKFLNAVSVGFIPLRWLNADGSEHSLSATKCGRDAVHLVPDPTKSMGTPGTASLPRNQAFHRKYLSQELLEVSAVGIPANPEALQLGLKAGAIQKADLKDLLELLTKISRETTGQGDHGTAGLRDNGTQWPTEFRSHTAGALANPSARGQGADGAQWLQLARALRDLLKRA